MAKQKYPKRVRPDQTGPITEDTPLTVLEQRFIQEYIKTGNARYALRTARGETRRNDAAIANAMLKQPNIQAEIAGIMEDIKNNTIMTAQEVLEYFTAVTRGEIKDQFGLDAPLSERTRAAQELAKRLIDVEARKEGTPDTVVAVKLDWGRD